MFRKRPLGGGGRSATSTEFQPAAHLSHPQIIFSSWPACRAALLSTYCPVFNNFSLFEKLKIMFSSQQTSFRGNLLLIMQIESTVLLILQWHHAGVCNPNRDRWTETQTFQRKESSTKFIEMLEAFLLKPILFTLPKESKGKSQWDFQTQQAAVGRVEIRKCGSTIITLVIFIFCDPADKVVVINNSVVEFF